MAEAGKALAIQPDIGPALAARGIIYSIQGKREELLAEQRQRIAKDPERVAAFEKGLAEGGYEGAQRALAGLWATRYEKAGGVPKAGAVPVRPCSIAWLYRDGRDSTGP